MVQLYVCTALTPDLENILENILQNVSYKILKNKVKYPLS